jgi:GNAT superfamily N-acetyltransferase
MAPMLPHDELAAQALDADAALMALGCEQFEADGASWVRDRQFPDIYDANHVTGISASSAGEVDRLLARAEVEFAHCSHRRYHVDFRTGPALPARLALEGYKRDDTLLMVLEGDLQGTPKSHDVRPVETDEDWEAYASLKAADWEEHRQKLPEPKPGPEIGEAFIHIYRRKAPALRYFIAYVEGKPAAFFSSWPGVAGVGRVEDLFTLPAYRHRGLATALMHRCVEDCRERGGRRVVIACDPTDTPKNMYRAMGFAPVGIAGHWLRRLPARAPSSRPS